MNIPDGWMVYPLMEMTIALFVILIVMLVVQIKTLRVLRSFQPPKKEMPGKQQMENLSFKDMR